MVWCDGVWCGMMRHFMVFCNIYYTGINYFISLQMLMAIQKLQQSHKMPAKQDFLQEVQTAL